MTYRRGSVVLVRYPFSSGMGEKARPALVIQADKNNRRLRNIILAMITTTIDRAGREPTQLLIEAGTTVGRESGLLRTSAVTCENLLTLEQQLILRTIGSLPAGTMKKVDACLKAALGLK